MVAVLLGSQQRLKMCVCVYIFGIVKKKEKITSKNGQLCVNSIQAMFLSNKTSLGFPFIKFILFYTARPRSFTAIVP